MTLASQQVHSICSMFLGIHNAQNGNLPPPRLSPCNSSPYSSPETQHDFHLNLLSSQHPHSLLRQLLVLIAMTVIMWERQLLLLWHHFTWFGNNAEHHMVMPVGYFLLLRKTCLSNYTGLAKYPMLIFGKLPTGFPLALSELEYVNWRDLLFKC